MATSRALKAIVSRWVWIGVFAAAGTLALFGLLPLGAPVERMLQAWLADTQPPCMVWCLHASPGILLLVVICRWLRPWATDVRLWLRYPPLWFAVALALILSAAVRSACVPVSWRTDLPTLRPVATVVAAFGVLVGLVSWWVRRRGLRPAERHAPTMRPMGAPAASGQAAASRTWQDIEVWSRRECPLEPTDPDLFDHAPLSRRLAGLLSQPQGEDVGIALLGPMGSGKSSVLARVRHHVRDATGPRLWFCDVHCWGLERSEFAPVHLLSRAVSEVGRHVDVSTLRGLPEHYQRFLTGEPSGWGTWVAGLLVPTRDPAEGLKQLSQVLEAVGARLVICIEDAERAGADFDPQHVQRLLWMLREARGVSFILAVDPRSATFDFAKMCDHIELMPLVDADHLRPVLRLLQDHCNLTTVDPAVHRGDFLGTEPSDLSRWIDARSAPPAVAIAQLVDTPRKLKQLVRRVKRVWDALTGEIDLEDLIIVNALREGAPAAFNFLLRHMDVVRDTETAHLQDAQSKRDDLKGALEVVLNAEPNAAAVRHLVDALRLPGLNSIQILDARLQRVARMDPTDYFRRLLAEEVPEGEVRDQEVLRDIRAWIEQDQGAGRMTQRLLASPPDTRYVAVWSHFSDRIVVDSKRLLALGDELLAGVLARDGLRAAGEDPALIAFRNRLRRGQELGLYVIADWLTGHIERALGTSLGFANDLYRLWAVSEGAVVYGPSGDPSSDRAADPRAGVRRGVVEEAQRRYRDPGSLAAVLDDQRWVSIRELIAPPDTRGQSLLDAEVAASWTWIVAPLLTLIAERQAAFANHLLPIVGDFSSSWHMTVPKPQWSDDYTLVRPRMQALFGEHLGDVLRYLANLEANDALHRAARVQAAAWLAEEDARHSQ